MSLAWRRWAQAITQVANSTPDTATLALLQAEIANALTEASNALTTAQNAVTLAQEALSATVSSVPGIFVLSNLDGTIPAISARRLSPGATLNYTGDATGGPTLFTGAVNVSTALTLDTVNANTGSFGDGTDVAGFTVNVKGLITAASNIPITSAPKWTTARTESFTGDATGGPTSVDGSANWSTALTLATVNANVGTFGSAKTVGQFTVNAKGLITAAISVALVTPVLFSALPGSPSDGQSGYITDGAGTAFAGLAAGAGTNHVPVYYDAGASAWRYG